MSIDSIHIKVILRGYFFAFSDVIACSDQISLSQKGSYDRREMLVLRSRGAPMTKPFLRNR